MSTIARQLAGGNPLPFGAVPHQIVTDPRLEPTTDCAVVARLLFHARWDDHTTVADVTIAKVLRVHVATVQRSLRRLQAAGWIRRRRCPAGPDNRTGRVIVLCWKLPDGPDERISDRVCAPVRNALRISAESATHECATTEIVVVEGVDNTTPQTPLSNDNDPDPGPAVLPIAVEECEARDLVGELSGSLAEAVAAVEPADEDAAAAEPAPRVYPMTEALRPTLDEVEAEATTLQFVGKSPQAEPTPPAAKLVARSPQAITEAPESSGQNGHLTPGQAEWLEWLATHHPERRATFDVLSPGRQAMVLARRPHGVCTDPMLLRMEAADLAPRRPVAAPRPVLTVEDAVGAIVGGHRPATAMLAELLAREFDDRRSWPFFDRIGGLLLANPAAADDFLDALRQARNPKAVNPGAVLVTALKRDHGW